MPLLEHCACSLSHSSSACAVLLLCSSLLLPLPLRYSIVIQSGLRSAHTAAAMKLWLAHLARFTPRLQLLTTDLHVAAVHACLCCAASEIFKTNSFEQLCINLTNEKLQQFFNQHTFKLEEKCYQDEGIKFQHVNYIDNQPVLDLIENRPLGILPSIDEELRMPKGSDKTWVDKLINTHRSNANFAPDRSSANNFSIRHYTGAVTYDSAGFLEKNKALLTKFLGKLDPVRLLTATDMRILFYALPLTNVPHSP